jgi:dienelactone hydrolase
LCGIKENGEYRDTPEGYHQDFGVELVKRGFIVAAPEISCFGEREAKYDHLLEGSPRPSTCHNASTYAMMLGMNMPGMRVWDGMRVLDYVEQLELADASRMGVMGISGGGMHAFFSSCIDPRIKAAVISGYFCDWRQSILAINHCTCNFVPGLLGLGELSDVAALIAPRPLLVEHGRRDTIFPIGDVENTVRRARRAWKVAGKATDLQTDFFNDGHRINGEKAYPFLEQCLARAK